MWGIIEARSLQARRRIRPRRFERGGPTYHPGRIGFFCSNEAHQAVIDVHDSFIALDMSISCFLGRLYASDECSAQLGGVARCPAFRTFMRMRRNLPLKT